MKRDDPIIWIGGGVGIAVIGFLLLDAYNPSVGLVWNIMYGNVRDVPYRYVLVIAVCLVMYGAYLWNKKSA